MAPIICIRVPDVGLQLLRMRMRQTEEVPLITVQEDRPSARVTACNAAAYALGVRPGMRYAQVLSLDRSIRAGVVTPQERSREIGEVEGIILEIVPFVERSRFEEGVFWVPTAGLDRHLADVYGPDRTLEEILVARIEQTGRRVRVAGGVSRAAPTVATAVERQIAFDRFDKEWSWLLGQPLTALPIPPNDAERMRFLGLRTIVDFIRLPEAQLGRRMSARTAEIYRFLQEERRIPVYRRVDHRIFSREYRFEYRIPSTDRLIERIEPMLAAIREEALSAALWISAVTITIRGEMEGVWRQRIAGGSATRDLAFLLRLVSLRLESQAPPTEELSMMRIEAECIPGTQRQGELIDTPTTRDAVSIDRRRLDDALLVLHAELGGGAVVRVLPGDDVVPERRLAIATVDSGRDLVWSGESVAGCLSAAEGVRRIRRIEIASQRASRDPEGGGAAFRETAAVGPRREGGAVSRRDTGAASRRDVYRCRRDGKGAVGIGETSSSRVPNFMSGIAAGTKGGTGPQWWGPFLLSSRWWTGDEMERIYRYRRCADGTLLWEYTLPGSRRVRVQGRVE